MSCKYTITSGLPYANGPLHIGHIAGAYLPADIYTRVRKLSGDDAIYICGTDEYGVPITITAEKEDVSPRVIVKRYHKEIKEGFANLNIQFDNFSGTSNLHNKHHAALSREFFTELKKNDYISSKIEDQLHCKECDRFLADRYVEGVCPKCGNNEARGDECSVCNAQYTVMELGQPKCKLCGNEELQKVPTKHWYLKLDVLQQQLEEWIDSKDYWKENVVNFVKGWFKDGLRERAITRDLHWGVPVPLNDAVGKVLYVWFDAPIGYISSTMEWAEKQGDKDKWKERWQNPDAKIVHFIGKDNIPFHSIIWPAMLIGQKKDYQLPWHIPANEYLNIGIDGEEGSKASTSKGNVVWVNDYCKHFAADYLRYYLALNAPEKSDFTFTWKDLQARCNNELLGVLGNLANRVLKFIGSNFEGVIPAPQELDARDNEVLEKIKACVEKVTKSYDSFEVRQAVAEIVNLGRLGNQYFDEKAPWKTAKSDRNVCGNTLYVTAQLVHKVVLLLAPVIPESCDKLWKQLGYENGISSWDELQKDLPAGQKIHKPQGVFSKIEDKVIQQMEENLRNASQTEDNNEQPKVDLVPLKEDKISYDQFLALDIRMGKVLEAEKVAKTKKLLHLKVDIGHEVRQIIAGLAEYYTPEELIGKTVPVLVNLEPAKIRGLVSEGMVLCADIDGQAITLHPGKEVCPGAIVR